VEFDPARLPIHESRDPPDMPNDQPLLRSGVNFPATTWVMSALCVLLTLAHHTSNSLPYTSLWYRIGHFGHLPAEVIWSGHWPALFTTFFIHGDPARPLLTVAHLGFNLVVLIQAGRVLEASLHPLAYYLFFVLSAIVGSSAELALTGSSGVGASGVVYAMFGLLWAGRSRDEEWAEVANPMSIGFVVGWAFLCVALTWLNIIRVANAAHFAGLFFGLSVGWVFVTGRHRIVGAVTLAGLAAVVALSLTWLPWSPRWTFWKGTQAMVQGRYDEAINWFEQSGRLGFEPAYVSRNIQIARERASGQ
jgi:membrane associated rhomboid family serine protease